MHSDINSFSKSIKSDENRTKVAILLQQKESKEKSGYFSARTKKIFLIVGTLLVTAGIIAIIIATSE